MPLVGDLATLTLPDLFYIFKLRAMTGHLALEWQGREANLTFNSGRLVAASASDPHFHLGQTLLRSGKISLERLASALSVQNSESTPLPLGQVLVDNGWLSAYDLELVLTMQAEEILSWTVTWPDGRFRFSLADELPLQHIMREIDIERVVLEALRRADEQDAMVSCIPHIDCGVRLLTPSNMLVIPDGVGLTGQVVVASVAAGAATVRQVIATTGLPEIEVVTAIYRLVVSSTLAIDKGSSDPNAAGLPADRSGLAPTDRVLTAS